MAREGVGMRLRHARKMRGLTQQALAKASGVKQASISEVETGESKSPIGTNLVKLALSLQVSPEWLASGKGPMQAPDSPLSPEAVNVARDWEKLAPEIRTKLADMIHQLAVTAESFGPPVEDEKVAAAYGKPGQKHRSK